jgi:predicted phage terminase large subunit-like protein
MTKIIETKLVNKMMKDKLVRTAITKDSFLYFFHFYYAHYVKYETADFQKEIIHYLEKSHKEDLYIVAFRGSGKSTMVTTAYPLWAILGKQQKKFCVILCQTQAQAKQHMMNIKRELEDNDLLRRDLGPFKEESDEWGAKSLVFNKHGARISVASTDQSIRGLRHHEHRPDLFICDDVEDIQSTKTRESRAKTYGWLHSEVIPAGDKDTRLIIVGNLLHEDSLLMRIKDDVDTGKKRGTFLEYPLIDKNDQCLWTGKYTTKESLEEERLKIANEVSWQREYLLRIIPTDEQVVHREWIHYYNEVPIHRTDSQGWSLNKGVRIGVDLAISEKETADYTSMVSGRIIGEGSKTEIYILPNIINKKMTFPETIKTCKSLYMSFMGDSRNATFIIEDVAYQKALPQQLKTEGVLDVKSSRPMTDKRSRLALTTHLIQTGRILFPRHGAEELINQIVNFGVEKHDDLADAFSILILNCIEQPTVTPRIYFV